MILMRGCPGSGKSYLAHKLITEYGGQPKDYVFSTDDYFMRGDIYDFKVYQLSAAHEWNRGRVLENLKRGVSPVVVDNSNTQLWEMSDYAQFAMNNGYFIEILEPNTPWFSKLDELAKRNIHGVPAYKLEEMLVRYERLSVEDLIQSTARNYSRPPPQLAERNLLSQKCP